MNLLEYSEVRNSDLIDLLGNKIDLSQRILLGKVTVYSKHQKIYDVKPFDNTLPNFNIKFKSKKTGPLIIAFKIKNSFLENSTNKLQKPEGIIIDIIGREDEVKLNDILIRHYSLKPKSKKVNLTKKELLTRIDLTYLNTVSIDPSETCQDIDDALSLEYLISNKTLLVIGIHIANPTSFLSKETILKRSESMVESLYPYNDKTINLWGDKITKMASLEKNKKKPCLSLLIKLNKYNEKYDIKNIELKPSWIINKENLSYESAEENKTVKELINITKNIDYKKNSINDTHELISFWMIFYNQYIGIIYKDVLPHRVHHLKITQEFDKLSEDIKYVFRNKSMEAAYYSLTETNHDSMNKMNITHASSPIRRLFDTCIHYYILYEENLFNEKMIQNINNFKKKINKFNNQNKILEWIDKIQDKVILEMTIYQLKDNFCEAYHSSFGFLKFELVPKKVKSLLNFNITKIGEDIVKIIIEKDNLKLKVELFGKIKVIIKKKKGFLPKEKYITYPEKQFNLFD